MAITPYLYYRDAGAAVEWLIEAFGLSKAGEVLADEDGRVRHASLRFGKALLLLGSPGPDFKGPRAIGHRTQSLYVDVDDVASHHAKAVEAGAKIIEEPAVTAYGARRYGAEDLEGHQWYFAQALRGARKASTSTQRKRPTARKKEREARGRRR